LGDKVSKFVKLRRGIAQGSTLGPLLFNIKLNDMGKLPLKCKIIRFADDIVILISGPINEIEMLLEVLKRDVEVVYDFHEIN
jgi:Reverse transcriptase (RNA-dependent DNA polymerase)